MASWKLMLKVVAIYICVHIINIVEYCISFIYMYSVCVCVLHESQFKRKVTINGTTMDLSDYIKTNNCC